MDIERTKVGSKDRAVTKRQKNNVDYINKPDNKATKNLN
jgi:hypothetical protein